MTTARLKYKMPRRVKIPRKAKEKCHEEEAGVVIRPQDGPQSRFLQSAADIVFYGGAAGGGKSYALLLECVRYASRPGFGGVIFRRTYPEITNEGGLWDTAEKIFPYAGAVPRRGACEWYWPDSQVTIAFNHLQREDDKHRHQGAAYPFIGFDEVTHFSRGQFFYLISRNRLSQDCGVRPYVRCTCNPDPDSWVAEFIEWWIDQKTGLPIPERDGVVRWFAREGDQILWASRRETLMTDGQLPKSVTFIAAKLTDNKILMKNDPGYEANLKAMPLVERERLEKGNWKVRPVAGMIFRKAWFDIVDVAPEGGRTIRYWDRAATKVSQASPDPDWTRGVKVRYVNRRFYVLDVASLRGTPDEVKRLMRNTAYQDGEECEVWAEQDPGSAGVAEIGDLSKEFQDRVFRAATPKGSKVVRAMPASAQAEAGNISVVLGRWNSDFLQELEGFADWGQVEDAPRKKPHDDQVDGFSGAINSLASQGLDPRIR